MISEVFIKIYGAVQGVGFRYYAERIAANLNLTGYVKNASDGTVEIFAQGNKENLEKLITWASRGPDLARIEKVEVEWHEVTETHSRFLIAE